MKRIRLIPVLLLCLAMTALSANALAAPKAATTKPTVKISVPGGAMRGGVGGDIAVTPSVPGFLTLKLHASDGAELLTICENKEVHTRENLFAFEAYDADGVALAKGDYQLCATMVDQYGNVSKEATSKLKLGSPKPALDGVAVSSTADFKLTVSANAQFDDSGATVLFSLYRTNPQAMYFDDFPEAEIKAPGAVSATLDLKDGNALSSPAGYYTVKGVVTESKSEIDSDEIAVDFVIDGNGSAMLLEDAGEDMLAAVDAAISGLTAVAVEPSYDEEDGEAYDEEEVVEEEVVEEAPVEEEPAEKAPVVVVIQPAEETAAPAPAATAAPAASTASDTVAFQSGNASVGPDGLEIGVGVGDASGQTDAGYWTLSANATNEEIWAAITRTMKTVDVGESESAYIYNSPEDGRKRIGTVSGLSQALNVIKEREDGWALVEAYRNEDGAFVRGYIRSNKLRVVEPNTTYGIVIDKAAQKLTVWQDGAPIGSCAISTGLATEKYLQRETPAGEYILVTRRGTVDYYSKGFSKYAVRISGNYLLCEIPTTKKNGSDFSILEGSLGTKSTRGYVCVAHEPSADGGINAEWIWEMTDANKKIKVLILDDKDRTSVPVGK